MPSLMFLAVAFVIIALGAAVVWIRERAGSRFDSSIDRFEAEMGALAPGHLEAEMGALAPEPFEAEMGVLAPVRTQPDRRRSASGGSGRS